MALRSFVPWVAVLFISAVTSQNCYYPNGTLSTGPSREAPCSAKGGICCPLDWECESNGLCYYGPTNYYGRYSCTDPTWEACPDICTYQHTAFGAEALLICNNDKWCCDHDRPADAPCCNQDGVDYLNLPPARSVATITALVPVTAPASTIHNAHSTSSAVQTTSSSPPPTTAQSHTAATLTHESTTTGKDGSILTVTQVTTIVPSGTGLGADQGVTKSGSGTNLGMILGLALGIPLVLILAAILIFLYRRKQRNNNSIGTRPPSPPQMANYANIPPGTHAPELAGYPVADTRNSDNRSSELSGDDKYTNSPTISSRTGEYSPPSYSSGSTWYANMAQAKSVAMKQIPEEPQEPQELPGDTKYVPYRPENARLPPERGDVPQNLMITS